MITRIRVPSKWQTAANCHDSGWRQDVAIFVLGIGPCGKTVEVLECNFLTHGVEIVQICSCTERKVFVYPWATVTGRVEVTYG